MDELKKSMFRKINTQIPQLSEQKLLLIIDKMKKVTMTPTENDWRKVILDVCGTQNQVSIKGQDLSDLNMLLSQIISELRDE